MKCFHHNDLDGWCAGAIVFHASGKKCDMIEMDYKDRFPLEVVALGEKVVIVDFSIKPAVMKKLLERTKDILWLDHHKTAMEYEKKYGAGIPGIRSNDYSGCELAWMVLYEGKPMPRAVELIGDMDRWAWKFNKETSHFIEGSWLHDMRPVSVIWEALLGDDKKVLKDTIERGQVCVWYRQSICREYVRKYGFETEFEGYKCVALGLYMFGSLVFGSLIDEYDICLSFEFVGDEWLVGLYSKKVDVSVIARKYGGGGHKGAAGFICNELPFRKR